MMTKLIVFVNFHSVRLLGVATKDTKGVNQRVAQENNTLKGKLASVDENAVRKLRTELAAANQRAENADLATAQEKEKTNRE